MNKLTKQDLMAECRPVENLDDRIVDMACESWLKEEPEILPHKQFRFTIDSKTFPRLTSWVNHAEYSLLPKSLTVKYYDVTLTDKKGNVTSPVRDYINHMMANWTEQSDSISLTNYDGKGNAIGKVEFDRCVLAKHHAVHSYGTKEEHSLIHELTFTFDYANIS
jgi:hypothetical protein